MITTTRSTRKRPSQRGGTIGPLTLLAWAWVASASLGQDLRAGLATTDITPPVGWRLYGNYYEKISTGVHDRLHAKALVLAQGDTRCALVICDLGGIGRDVADRVRERAEKELGIPADHVVMAATHTHGGPLHFDFLREFFHNRAVDRDGEDPREPIDYVKRLEDQCLAALAEAKDKLGPVSASAGTTNIEGLAFNRRFHMKNGTVRFNPGKKNPEIDRVAGPIDPEAHFLALRDTRDERPVGSLTVFAIHTATFGGSEFGADFPGHLQERLREALGDRLVSLFGEGTAGDINHVDVTSDQPQTSDSEPRRIGRVLADGFLKSMPAFREMKAPKLAVKTTRVPVPLREVTAEEVAHARAIIERSEDPKLDFLVLVQAHQRMDTSIARRRFGANLPMLVQAVRLDEGTALVCLPHEVFVELGLAIKKGSPFPNTFVISLCNDVDFYVPTLKAFAEGSYEVVNSRIKPGGGEMLVAAALKLLEELKGAGPVPK